MRVIYTIGPSGAGKDSVLEWIRLNSPPQRSMRFAQRVIDRARQSQGEQHESIGTAEFEILLSQNAFAMHWTANGHCYGIRHSQLLNAEPTQWTFVNGSRSHLETALKLFPSLVILHITAPERVLAARLAARNRESARSISQRLQRQVTFVIPPDCAYLEVRNDGELAIAGQQVLEALHTV